MESRKPTTVKTFFPDVEPTWPSSMKPGEPLTQIDQISILVEDVGKAIDYFGLAFGWGPFYQVEYQDKAGEHGELGDYHLKMAFAQVGPIEIELLQYLDGDTPHREHLQKKGEGLFHLRIKADDIESALRDLETQSIKPIWDCWIGGVLMSTYLNSHANFGVRTEIIRPGEQILEVLEKNKK